MKDLFGPDFLRRLERVRVHFLRGREEQAGNLPSARPAGEGMEFQDYRGYAAGDDPRYIDWNALARLDRVFLKRFRREEGASVALLVDLSASMGFGEPSKERLARQLAGGIGAVALASGAAARLFLAGESLDESRFEGRSGILPFLERLAAARTGGDGRSLEAAFRRLADAEKRQEAFVLTDCLFPAGLESFWRLVGALQGRAALSLVHVLAREEREPPWSGPLRLRDAESGEILDLEAGPESASRYGRVLEEFLAAIDQTARQHGIPVERAGSEEPFDEPLIRVLR